MEIGACIPKTPDIFKDPKSSYTSLKSLNGVKDPLSGPFYPFGSKAHIDCIIDDYNQNNIKRLLEYQKIYPPSSEQKRTLDEKMGKLEKIAIDGKTKPFLSDKDLSKKGSLLQYN